MSYSTAVPSGTRAPQLRMLANGNLIHGAISAHVVSQNNFHADTAECEVSLSADPSFGMAWWDAQTQITIEIQLALGFTPQDQQISNGWRTVFIGNVDRLKFDLTTLCVDINARDMSSIFIDAKTQKAYANQTSSQIVQTIIAEHQSGANGVTAYPKLVGNIQSTSTIVGQYYQLEHDRIQLDNLSHQTTEWDLMVWLCKEEDFDLWMNGWTLNFQPTGQTTGQPYVIGYTPAGVGMPIPTLNVEHLSMTRNLTFATDIQVTVKSSNLRNGAAYQRVVRGTPKGVTSGQGAGGASSQTQNYVFNKPGLTPDQALRYAQQKLAELSKHERVLDVTMPGDLTLTTRSSVRLMGTNTGFDQSYLVESIDRHITFGQGYTQTARIKNTSPRSESTVL